jgi:uncharacterized OB-fold protein
MTVPSAEPPTDAVRPGAVQPHGPAEARGPESPRSHDPLRGPDPRPRLAEAADGLRLAGWRCGDCGYPVAVAGPWCPRCRGELVAAAFGPEGTAWASTVVRVPLPGRQPPWGMVYVDLADGPRVLGHLESPRPVPVGTTMELAGLSASGDLIFRPAGMVAA